MIVDNNTSNRPLPGGTKVLNTDDGEPGTIVNGFTFDAATGAWIEYEVETAYGIERWPRGRFVLMSEIEQAGADKEDRR